MSTPLQERICRHCQMDGPHLVEPRTDGVHYADVRCRGCNRHMGFLPKPDSDKVKRPGQHRDMVAKFSTGRCELCLTHEEQLPKGETLEAHHVVPFKDGGEATRENCWILCTACHKLVEWQRTYRQHVFGVAEKLTAWRDDEAPF